MRQKISLIGRAGGSRNARVFYAVKANPDIQVLRLLNGLGTGFEIASEGELEILSRLNVGPERIISSNPVKTLKFLKMAASYGVRLFAFDSVDEVEKLVRYIPTPGSMSDSRSLMRGVNGRSARNSGSNSMRRLRSCVMQRRRD